MDYPTGKLLFIFVAAVMLAFAAAQAVAWRYRAVLARLMQASTAPPAPADAAAAPTVAEPDGDGALAPAAASLGDNRRAAWRLSAGLLGLSLLIAASNAWLQLAVMDDLETTPHRLLLLTLLHLWPAIPVLGVAWRWSRLQVIGAILLQLGATFAILMWRSTEAQSAIGVLSWMALGVGLPMVVVCALCLGGSTRAVAPWLLPPFIGLVWASVAGIDSLGWLLANAPGSLVLLTETIGPSGVMALAATLPWLIAWWPMRRLAHALATAYARKRISELLLLFAAVWGVALLFESLSAASSLGPGGAVMLLPLAWIGLAALWLRRRGAAAAAVRAPTLLVLRVFQRDAATRQLFDEVIERWRLSGNTVLIAGTDLVDRTLDGDDVFRFLDGQLGARFIRGEADVAARIDAFDLAPDLDGRFRINECYCHDSGWKAALAALVQRSDVALMDLRGFAAHNAGCRHELGVLARSRRLGRVVVLTDAQTDRAAARLAAAGAPAQRFIWLDAAAPGRRRRHAVLAALFGGNVTASPGLATHAARGAR